MADGVDAVGDESGEETPDLVERQRDQGLVAVGGVALAFTGRDHVLNDARNADGPIQMIANRVCRIP
jgi:hypothetical protein